MMNNLRELRASRGLTQAELGKHVGVSRQAIIAIEGDQHDPSLDLAFKMAAFFTTTVESIFTNHYMANDQ